MTIVTDEVATLELTLAQTDRIVSSVRDDEWSLPTPCEGWDVSKVSSHLVGAMRKFRIAAEGRTPEWGVPEPVEGDLVDAYRQASADLLAAWRTPGALDTTRDFAGRQVPAVYMLGLHRTEVVLHGWDVAKAVGRTDDLDPRLAESALAFSRAMLRPEFRGTPAEGRHFGHEVPVPEGAPAYDRLAGWMGRSPH
jgi:uncharacterized protein (TIGR03086 family)